MIKLSNGKLKTSIERLSIYTEYRTTKNKTDLGFRHNNPPTTTVAKMNPKKAKEMFFHSELSEEVVILDVVVSVAIKKKKVEAFKNVFRRLISYPGGFKQSIIIIDFV